MTTLSVKTARSSRPMFSANELRRAKPLPSTSSFQRHENRAGRYRTSRHPNLCRCPTKLHNIGDLGDIDTYLGEDLQCLEHDGRPLWNGDREALHVRPANAAERQRWLESWQSAIDSDSGEHDASDESWLAFLVPVTDPTDDPSLYETAHTTD